MNTPPRAEQSRRVPRKAPAAERLSPRLRYRRAISLLCLSAVLPGSAQVIAGNRRAGLLALRIWAVVVAVGVVLLVVALFSWQSLVGLGVRPRVLTLAQILLVLGAFGWLALLVDAWRLGRPARLRPRQRPVVTGIAAVLAVALCGPMLWAAHLAGVQRDWITSVFAQGTGLATDDGRLNVLLLGGDAGPTRVGMRPDSINLASIEVETGRAVLFSLPRNLEHARFPDGTAAQAAHPKGFDGMLNAVYTYGVEHPELFRGAADAGAEATMEAVSGTLGIPVHNYVLVDLKGFRSLVDALGGVRIDVEARIPIGGGTSPIKGWIEPGPQKLDGYHALWYARSREGSNDYVRMGRQRCVMGALLQQADPLKVLRRFQSIASSTKSVVRTDLPQRGLPAMVELALRAKTGGISTVAFVPPLIRSSDPDVKLIRSRVRSALAGERPTQDARADRSRDAQSDAAAAPQAQADASQADEAREDEAPEGKSSRRTTGRPGSSLSATCSSG